MKIRKIIYQNNPLLGDLELDFTDTNGNAVNTIIIAGENGVGKSYILNTIFDITRLSLENKQRDEVRIFEIELSIKELRQLENNDLYRQNSFADIQYSNILTITINYNILNSWEQINIVREYEGNPNVIRITLPGYIFGQVGINKILNAIFSDVEINFTPEQIDTVKSSNIDRTDLQSQKSHKNLATEISQLLIDVQSLDALEFSEWARINVGKPIDEKNLDTRIKRFTSAWSYMFPRKKYKRIENQNNGKQIIFEENGNEMSIGQLSSGEKQIVFRGSFLLKDKESSKGALILIDEPEISLHPNWQLKVLSFFKKLFTDTNGEQTSQIIISTHSPFILHNANRNDDKVIILQKDEEGKVVIPNEAKFFGWSTERIIEKAFNISHQLAANKTTVFLEGETDEKYFNKCLEVFDKMNISTDFKWIGRINENGNAENTGDKALNQAKTFFTANMEQAKTKIVLLYDHDTGKPDEDIENLLVRTMNINADNNLFKKGIENLLVLDGVIENTDQFYSVNKMPDDYGGETITKKLDKSKLSDFICSSLNRDAQKKVLAKILIEVERFVDRE